MIDEPRSRSEQPVAPEPVAGATGAGDIEGHVSGQATEASDPDPAAGQAPCEAA